MGDARKRKTLFFEHNPTDPSVVRKVESHKVAKRLFAVTHLCHQKLTGAWKGNVTRKCPKLCRFHGV